MNSEIDDDEFADKAPNFKLAFIQADCLKQARSAPKFICLLDGSFGDVSFRQRDVTDLRPSLTLPRVNLFSGGFYEHVASTRSSETQGPIRVLAKGVLSAS